MKLIALCTRINIPVIYHKHPFSELITTEHFYNEKQTRQHVDELAEKKLLPFLQSAERLANQFGIRFKMALSISGISIKLLEKYVPQIPGKLLHLSQNGIIDFTAGPWSNSLLSWFNQNELSFQTDLHRRTINAVFGRLPKVYMADLPLNAENHSGFEPFPGCRTNLTCSNHLASRPVTAETASFKKTQFLINFSLSQKLQDAAENRHHDDYETLSAPFIRYLRKHASLVKPLIIRFDPLAKNISSYCHWEQTIAQLMKVTKGSLYSLSDLEEIANYFAIDNNYSAEMLEQFKVPDYWFKNNMQKEAFKQFKNIYKSIHTTNISYLPEAWDYLQDLNNFFYMSDAFFLDEFTRQHFSPYRSPHEAFTSYMNAIGSFWIISNKKSKPLIKTRFFISPAIN